MVWAMLCCSVAALAQPEDGTYYLYDSANGLFFARGDSWNTRAVLGPGGWPCEFDATSGTLHLLGANSNHYLFATNDGVGIYTDGDANKEWLLEPVDGGYKLKNKTKESYIGRTTPEFSEYYHYALTPTSNPEDAVVWSFLTPEEYKEKLNTELPALNYKNVIDLSGIDCNAEDFLTTINSYEKENISSITSSFDDWTVIANKQSNIESKPNDYAACEAWQRIGILTKTFGDLSSGIYKVSLSGFERCSSWQNCESWGETENSTSFLKANTEEVAFKSWYSGKTGDNDPDNVAQAQTKFSDGKYNNEIYCYVGEDGKLKIDINYFALYIANRWIMFNNLEVTRYKIPPLVEYRTALQKAEDAIGDELYTNVKGKEYADLRDAIATYGENVSDYEAAIEALNKATAAFIEAKDAYDALIIENGKVPAFGIDPYEITEETTAEIADAKTKELKVAEFNHVATEFPTDIQLGEWEKEGPTGELKGQHWDGTDTSLYLEQSGEAWGQSSWEITYKQTITLPKGKYVFKMTGRHGSSAGPLNNTMSLVVKDGESQIGIVDDFPARDNGLGVNKNGETSFDPADPAGFANENNGRGWEWRYVPFTLTEEKTITISIEAKATAAKQWCSFCNYSVVATADNAAAAIIAYKQKQEEAKALIAENENIFGKEAADLKALAEATPEFGTKAEVDEATAAIEAAMEAFKADAVKENCERYVAAKETAETAEIEFTDYTVLENSKDKDTEAIRAEANTLFISSMTAVNNVPADAVYGFEAGEWAPYIVLQYTDVIKSLQTDGTFDNEKVDAAESQTMKDAVTGLKGITANTEEINAVANGNFANTDYESTGWSISEWKQFKDNGNGGNWLSAPNGTVITYGASKKEAFKMALKPNTAYYLDFRHTAWDNGNPNVGGKVSVLDGNNNGLQEVTYDATKENEHFTFKTGTDESDYVLTFTMSAGRGTITDIVIKKANLDISENAGYAPEETVANVTLTRTFVEGWNGLVLPFDMTADEAKAKFGASEIKDFDNIEVTAEGTILNFADATGGIKAGQPVMIKIDTTPENNVYTIGAVSLTDAEPTVVSKEADGVKYTFTGTYADKMLEGKTTVINGTHFYNYEEGENVTAKGFRSYFLNETDAANSAKSKIIGLNIDGDTTGISEVKTTNRNENNMFDMQGHRVITPAAKGIYIKNGRKVIIK